MSRILLWAIRAYQFVLSPWIGTSCRYWPTCSDYSTEAITRFGALRGGWLTLARLGRCHPYGRGGVDPVPASFHCQCRCADDGEAAKAHLAPRSE